MTTKDDREAFLSRWSRLKSEAREEPDHEAPEKNDESKPAPELPSIEDLNYDSDFKAFMDKRVDQRLRRLALKKLFKDPHFNIPDGLDDYAEDYTLLEDLPEDMVALQQHARRVLFGPDDKEQSGTDDSQVAPAGGQPGEQIAADENHVTRADDAGDVRGEESGASADSDNKDGRQQG